MSVLSIIIPVKEWEDERFILLLNSIRLLETRFDVEVIIVYAAQSPQALLDANNLKLKNVKLIYLKPNGIYNAFNLGVQNAGSNWVMFFGSDDLILPSLADVTEELQLNQTDYSAIVCNVAFGNKGLFKPFKNKYGLIFRNWCQQGVLYNKQLFNKNLFDQTYPIQADHKFNLQVASGETHRIKYIETIVAYFNTTGISQSVNDINFWTDMPEIVTQNYGLFWGKVSLLRRTIGKILRFVRQS